MIGLTTRTTLLRTAAVQAEPRWFDPDACVSQAASDLQAVKQ